jgi:hypothetical protein
MSTQDWLPISNAPRVDNQPLLMFGYCAGCEECQFVGWWDDFVMYWSSLGGPCEPTHFKTLGPNPDRP